jgi:hypothetical protein
LLCPGGRFAGPGRERAGDRPMVRILSAFLVLLLVLASHPAYPAAATSYTVSRLIAVTAGARGFALVGDTVWVLQGGMGVTAPHHVFFYDPDGTPKPIPSAIVPADLIDATFANNLVYAVSGNDARLYIFNPDGSQTAGSPLDLHELGVSNLQSITQFDNRLWIGTNNRILILDFDGTPTDESPIEQAGMVSVAGIAPIQGKIWATDSYHNVLYIFKEDGTLAQPPITGNGLDNPYGIAAVGDEVWIANYVYGKGTISRFALDGSPSRPQILLERLGVPPPAVAQDLAVIDNSLWLSNNSFGFEIMDVKGISLTPARPSPFITEPLTIGWYTGVDVSDLARLDRQKAHGETIQIAYINRANDPSNYLAALERSHLRAFLQLDWNAAATGNVAALTAFVNTYKDNSAIAGWLLYDEPEFNDVGADVLVKDYQAIKAADPSHPVAVSFGNGYCSYVGRSLDANYFRTADIFLFVSYPIGDQPEFAPTADGRHSMDDFPYIVQNCIGYIQSLSGNKQFMMIAQAFRWGATGAYGKPNRNPTYGEERFFTFMAFTQPIAGLLYWVDYRADETLTAAVHRVMDEVTSLGAAIRNGITNDPSIDVSSDAIMYRYGTDGKDTYLIAVNNSNATTTVTFTLPAAVTADTAVLVHDAYDPATQQYQARTIPLSRDAKGVPTFADTFTRYQVHIYRFAGSSPARLTGRLICASSRICQQ